MANRVSETLTKLSEVASGVTATEREKQQYKRQQDQDRFSRGMQLFKLLESQRQEQRTIEDSEREKVLDSLRTKIQEQTLIQEQEQSRKVQAEAAEKARYAALPHADRLKEDKQKAIEKAQTEAAAKQAEAAILVPFMQSLYTQQAKKALGTFKDLEVTSFGDNGFNLGRPTAGSSSSKSKSAMSDTDAITGLQQIYQNRIGTKRAALEQAMATPSGLFSGTFGEVRQKAIADALGMSIQDVRSEFARELKAAKTDDISTLGIEDLLSIAEDDELAGIRSVTTGSDPEGKLPDRIARLRGMNLSPETKKIVDQYFGATKKFEEYDVSSLDKVKAENIPDNVRVVTRRVHPQTQEEFEVEDDPKEMLQQIDTLSSQYKRLAECLKS